MAWRVSGVDGAASTRWSARAISSSSVATRSTPSTSNGALERRSATTLIPSASARCASAWPMEPKPYRPRVVPCTSRSDRRRQSLACSSQISGTRLAAVKIAASTYSAMATDAVPRAEVTTGPSNSQSG